MNFWNMNKKLTCPSLLLMVKYNCVNLLWSIISHTNFTRYFISVWMLIRNPFKKAYWSWHLTKRRIQNSSAHQSRPSIIQSHPTFLLYFLLLWVSHAYYKNIDYFSSQAFLPPCLYSFYPLPWSKYLINSRMSLYPSSNSHHFHLLHKTFLFPPSSNNLLWITKVQL